MVRRYLQAFRAAFWAALHQETKRHTQRSTLEITVDADQAHKAITALEARLDTLYAKVRHVSDALERVH